MTAGLLGVVLAAMAIVTAFITRDFVAAVGSDLRDEMTPFWSTAVVGAVGLLAGVAALAVGPVLPWWAFGGALAFTMALIAWLVVAVVQLVQLIAYFASVRGRLLQSMLDTELARTQRLRQTRESAGSPQG